jgi:hypothetical protein
MHLIINPTAYICCSSFRSCSICCRIATTCVTATAATAAAARFLLKRKDVTPLPVHLVSIKFTIIDSTRAVGDFACKQQACIVTRIRFHELCAFANCRKPLQNKVQAFASSFSCVLSRTLVRSKYIKSNKQAC